MHLTMNSKCGFHYYNIIQELFGEAIHYYTVVMLQPRLVQSRHATLHRCSVP